MQNKNLHIISFDNPFPPNYGGIIDVFYKIKALHALGFKIHLHCFYDSRNTVSPELKAVTEEVYLYKKNKNSFFFFSTVPFSVKSRFHNNLVKNIAKIDAPIFFEGLQTTMLLRKVSLQNKKYLRLHNLESNFYRGMTSSETNWFKKIIFYFESKKYKIYQNLLNQFDQVFAISNYEYNAVKAVTEKVTYLPVFHGNTKMATLSDYGNYAFYHGDLRLSDNKKAAQFVIEIFKEIPEYSLIIASSNGKEFIENQVKDFSNINFVSIENEKHLDMLLEKAHINVMLSFQQSGTKLKVINSLFKSRFCLINKNMVDDQRILELCEIASFKEEFILKIKQLIVKPFLDNKNREVLLLDVLNDAKNANVILELFKNPVT